MCCFCLFVTFSICLFAGFSVFEPSSMTLTSLEPKRTSFHFSSFLKLSYEFVRMILTPQNLQTFLNIPVVFLKWRVRPSFKSSSIWVII